MKSSKLKFKCPVEKCKSKFSSIEILTAHLAIKIDSPHKAWKKENGILESKLRDEDRKEIKKILESRMQYNPATKLYEFY